MQSSCLAGKNTEDPRCKAGLFPCIHFPLILQTHGGLSASTQPGPHPLSWVCRVLVKFFLIALKKKKISSVRQGSWVRPTQGAFAAVITQRENL